MAETQAMIGFGSTFSIADSNSSPFDWIDLGEVTDITPPSATVDQIDVTHMTSPGGRREFVPGLIDPGECSFTLNYIPGSAGDVVLLAILAADPADRARSCRIIYPNGYSDVFTGVIQSYQPTVPTGDKMTAEVGFKVSGNPERFAP